MPGRRLSARPVVILERAVPASLGRIQRGIGGAKIDQKPLEAGMLPQQNPAGLQGPLKVGRRERPTGSDILDRLLQSGLIWSELVEIDGDAVDAQPAEERLPRRPAALSA